MWLYMIKREYKVISLNGLSSRASVALVNEANKYDSESTLLFQNEEANMKSIMNVMALVIRNNETFAITVDGKDEEKLILGLEKVLRNYKIIE